MELAQYSITILMGKTTQFYHVTGTEQAALLPQTQEIRFSMSDLPLIGMMKKN
jgi:hypothetical protein